MLRFPRNKPVTPFIDDQKIWYLEAPEHLSEECLRPELFAPAREARKTDPTGFADHRMPEGCRWVDVDDCEEFEDRQAFLVSTKNRMLCLTIDAGIGKTTAMIETQFLRGSCLPGHLVIGEQFDLLPDSATEYLQGGWLVKKLMASNKSMSKGVARQLLRRKIDNGDFTLLVDSLDQTSRPDPHSRAAALATFLTETCPQANCVVSGRPPAINGYWSKLFEQSGPWRFAQLDQFTDPQKIRFLGEERAELLKRLDADVVANPRMLETICRIEGDDLSSIRTASDIYWRVTQETLNRNIRDQTGVLTLEPALFYFSMLAFESLKRGFLNGVPEGTEMEQFLTDVWNDRGKTIQDRQRSTLGLDFDAELKKLGKTNTFIEHAVLDTSETLKKLVWRDRTIQDFFAALWVSKFADDDGDVTWLRENQYVESKADSRKHFQFWRFAAEMPSGPGMNVDVWARSMSVLFERSEYRSSEMIHRSWPMMLELAGFNWKSIENEMTDYSIEKRVQLATRIAQAECLKFVNKTFAKKSFADWWLVRSALRRKLVGQLSKITNSAKRVILTFLSEYPGILHGTNGSSAWAIGERFEKSFVLFPSVPQFEIPDGTAVEFRPCHDEDIYFSEKKVTNEVLGLFSLGQCNRNEMKRSARGLSWYNAWAISLFFHGELPSERNLCAWHFYESYFGRMRRSFVSEWTNSWSAYADEKSTPERPLYRYWQDEECRNKLALAHPSWRHKIPSAREYRIGVRISRSKSEHNDHGLLSM